MQVCPCLVPKTSRKPPETSRSPPETRVINNLKCLKYSQIQKFLRTGKICPVHNIYEKTYYLLRVNTIKGKLKPFQP
jgi:hypothetical protein